MEPYSESAAKEDRRNEDDPVLNSRDRLQVSWKTTSEFSAVLSVDELRRLVRWSRERLTVSADPKPLPEDLALETLEEILMQEDLGMELSPFENEGTRLVSDREVIVVEVAE